MGNQNCEIQKFTDVFLVNLNSFLLQENSIPLNIFGKCKIYSKKTNQHEQILCKKIQVSKDEVQTTLQSYFEQRMCLQHPNLLKFYGYSLSKQHYLCTSNCYFNLYIEYHQISLCQENINRQKNEEIYQISELLYIIKTISNICQFCEQNDQNYPTISPNTLLLTESGQIKIIDDIIINPHSFSDSSNPTPIKKYICPEEISDESVINDCKVAIFQLGMTMLETTLIQDCSYIYSESGNISENTIQFLINQIKEIYGETYASLLKKMLDINPLNRANFSEICSYQFAYFDMQSEAKQEQNHFCRQTSKKIIEQKKKYIEMRDLQPIDCALQYNFNTNNMQALARTQQTYEFHSQSNEGSENKNKNGNQNNILGPKTSENTSENMSFNYWSQQNTTKSVGKQQICKGFQILEEIDLPKQKIVSKNFSSPYQMIRKISTSKKLDNHKKADQQMNCINLNTNKLKY